MIRPLMFRAASAAFAAALLLGPAAAQDKTPGSKLLPGSVYGYVSVPDVATLKERVDASALGAMLEDPKLQPAFDKIKAKVSESGGAIQANLGVSLQDLMKVPSGELSLGVFGIPGGADGGVGIIAILDYGSNESTVETLVEKAEAALEKNGSKRSTEEFEGVEVVVYTKAAAAAGSDGPDDLDIEGEDAEPAPGGPGNTVAWFRKDQRLVLGNGMPAIEAVLARWDGDHDDTLASNEVYGYIAAKTKTDDRDPVFVWFVDPIGATTAALSNVQGGPPQLQMAAAFFPALGLNKLKGLGGGVDLATEEFDSIGKVLLYVEQPATGVLAAFQFPPAELAPPDWATDAATGYFSANWDVPAAVDAVETLVDTFTVKGRFDQIMNDAANNPQAKVHPQKDLLDQLTGRIAMVNYPIPAPRTDADGNQAVGQQPAVVAIAVKDEPKLKDLLARLSQTDGFPGEKREFQGTTVYEMPTPNPSGGEPNKMAVAVAKGSLIFATDAARMEQVLRGTGGTPLVETDAYKEIAEHIPDKVSMVGYQNQKGQLKAIYEAYRTAEKAPQILAALNIDPRTLPPFDDIAKYMRTSGSYAVPDENGALFVSVGLKIDE